MSVINKFLFKLCELLWHRHASQISAGGVYGRPNGPKPRTKSNRRSRNGTVGLEIETSRLAIETSGLEFETYGLEISTLGFELRPQDSKAIP